jgi:hypothetical protein
LIGVLHQITGSSIQFFSETLTYSGFAASVLRVLLQWKTKTAFIEPFLFLAAVAKVHFKSRDFFSLFQILEAAVSLPWLAIPSSISLSLATIMELPLHWYLLPNLHTVSPSCAFPPAQVHQGFIFNPRTLKLSTCDIAERHRSKYLLSPVMLTLTENHLQMHVNLEQLVCFRLDLDPSVPSPLCRHCFRSHRRSRTPSCLVPSQASSMAMGFPNLLSPN